MTSKKLTIATITSLEDLTSLNLTFEEVYTELEKIIANQENNAVSLQESINQYKLAKIYIQYCNNILANAKLEIEKIDNAN